MSAADGVVVFDYTIWSVMFPELAGSVSLPAAQGFFSEGCLYVSNDPTSIVPYSSRVPILNLLTAHIAALRARLNGQPSSSVVGRVNSASEGSVSVGTEYAAPGTAAWFVQTKYGAQVWQALMPFCTARYLPGPPPQFNGLYRRRSW